MQSLSQDSDAYKQIGEQVDKVFSGAVSDITKGASNYYAPSGMTGGRAPSWAAGTEAQNLQVIGTQRFSGKVAGLPEEPTGEAPTGADREALLEKQKELNLELDKAKQKLLDIKTEEAGGTETAKTKLAIDEADAKQKGDAVENAKKVQAAAEADLAAAEKTGATQERITKLKTDVAKATEAVTTAEQKQAESTAKLDAAKAKQAGDTEKEKAAELALADLKIKAAGADVAARQTAEAEKLAIETRYAEQSKSLALQKAQEEIAAARTAAQDKIKDYDLEFRAKQISESQKVALTKAALADEIAQERSIYAQELALDNLRPPERQKILAELSGGRNQIRPTGEGDPTQGGRGRTEGLEANGRHRLQRAVVADQRRHQRHHDDEAGLLQHGEVDGGGRGQVRPQVDHRARLRGRLQHGGEQHPDRRHPCRRRRQDRVGDRERRGRDRVSGRQRHRLDRHRRGENLRRRVRLPRALARPVRGWPCGGRGGDRSFRRRGVRHRRMEPCRAT